MLAAHVGRRHLGLMFLRRRDDLFLAETAAPHTPSLDCRIQLHSWREFRERCQPFELPDLAGTPPAVHVMAGSAFHAVA